MFWQGRYDWNLVIQHLWIINYFQIWTNMPTPLTVLCPYLSCTIPGIIAEFNWPEKAKAYSGIDIVCVLWMSDLTWLFPTFPFIWHKIALCQKCVGELALVQFSSCLLCQLLFSLILICGSVSVSLSYLCHSNLNTLEHNGPGMSAVLSKSRVI